MSETRLIRESVDVRVLHARRSGSIAARNGILRVLANVQDGAHVELFLVADIGNGLVDLHIMLPPRQAGEVIDMLQEALMLLGGRDA